MGKTELEYGFADKAWQVVVGCDNTIPCWQHCWAKKTVARLAGSPNEKVSDAHAGLVRVTKAGLAWTGAVRINEAHLDDPIGWHKSAVIATGFHGDWGLLGRPDKDRMFEVMLECPQHQFFPLTKHRLTEHADYLTLREPMANVNIGFSLMGQTDADAALPMVREIAEAGWRVHVWHEPAIGPIDWRGWEFLSWLVVGGESGPRAAPFDLQWARDTITWGARCQVPIKIKQLGSDPRGLPVDNVPGWASHLNPRGENWECWPEDIRVREMPETR